MSDGPFGDSDMASSNQRDALKVAAGPDRGREPGCRCGTGVDIPFSV